MEAVVLTYAFACLVSPGWLPWIVQLLPHRHLRRAWRLLPIILLSTVALVPMIVNDRSQMQFGAALTFAATWWMMPWLALGLWMSKRRARRGEPGFEN